MKFPRLFWKIFFAMWLSIMAFAVLTSLINQRLVTENAFERPGRGYEVSLKQFKDNLSHDLETGGEQQLIETLRSLPRGLQRHIYVLNPAGRELLDRDRRLENLKTERVRITQEKIKSVDGGEYKLLSVHRRPPSAILAPGAKGVELRLAVAALISALISWLLAHYLAGPLGQLSRASKQLATGDLSVRVGSPLNTRKDEFGQLASDLDEMAGRLEVSQQANKRLLRDVSHELRSPLARLRVALEIARNKDSGNKNVRNKDSGTRNVGNGDTGSQEQSRVVDELDRIELESNRLEQLVDEVLSLLRETSGSTDLNLQQFDLTELLTDLVDTVNYEIPEGMPLIELRTDTEFPINADRELLWQVFENLLRNALIYAGTKQANQVETDYIKIDSGKTDQVESTQVKASQVDAIQVKAIEVKARQIQGDQLEVTVLDAGPGIAQEHISRIFEPFYRVDESRNRGTDSRTGNVSGGHGLGLAIAASAVRRHGGRIEASNAVQGGLLVKVVLPQRQPSSGA